MSRTKSLRALGLASTLATAGVLTFVVGPAQADEPGSLCRATSDAPVHTDHDGSSQVIYTIGAGHDLRFDHAVNTAPDGSGVWYYGHGEGHSDGWSYKAHYTEGCRPPQ
jgi:hypothetical protein